MSGRFPLWRAALVPLVVAALVLAGCGGDDGEQESGQVELRYSWWGNPDRAELIQQAIDRFTEQHPNITVTPSFQEFEAYWERMATEIAGGGGPDVLHMDYSYLREYADRGVLLDLGEVSEQLDTGDVVEGLQGAGEVDGTLYAVPIAGNTFGMVYRPSAFEEAGVATPEPGWSWDDYNQTIETITSQTDLYGGTDYTGIIYALEMQLRQEGGALFTEDGELGFDRARLTEFWNSTAALRDNQLVVSAEEVAEVDPITATGADLVATEMIWDNFLTRYAGETDAELALAPVPTFDPGNLGQYLKPSQLMSISARSEHPEEAAMLVDFMINDPEVGRIKGANMGIPSTNAQRDAVELEGVDQLVAEYEEALADQLSPVPPAPPAGAGTLEANFLRIHEEIMYGQLSVEEGVEQWFTEAEDVLGAS